MHTGLGDRIWIVSRYIREGIQTGLGDKIWIVLRYIKGGYTGLGDKIWIVSRYIKGGYSGRPRRQDLDNFKVYKGRVFRQDQESRSG